MGQTDKGDKGQGQTDNNDVKWLMDRQTSIYVCWVGLWLVSVFGLVSVLTNAELFQVADVFHYTVWLYSTLVGLVLFAYWRIYRSIKTAQDLVEELKDGALKNKIKNDRNKDVISKIAFPEAKCRLLKTKCPLLKFVLPILQLALFSVLFYLAMKFI